MRFDYLGLIVNDLLKRKFSSFLTLFAISLGILAIFVIFLLSQGFEDSISAQFEKIGSNRLYVFPVTSQLVSQTQTKGLTDNEVKLIENKPFVEKAYPYLIRTAQLKYGNDYRSASIIGGYFDEEYLTKMGLNIETGRIPKTSEKYSVIMGPLAASDTFDKEIKVGANIYLKDTKFKVVGILEPIGSPQDDQQIYFPLDTVRELYGDGDSIGIMDVVLVEGYDVELAKDNLQVFLDNRLGKDKVEIMAPTQLLEQVNSILSIVKLTLGGIGFVALIVGALGIINTMYVVVTEKTRDIGIMKAIGARNEDILLMYIFQAGIFGLLGAILGVFFGSLLALAFGAIAQSAGYAFLEITIIPSYVIALIIFGFIIGVISGYLPAKKASKINLVEAMRQ